MVKYQFKDITGSKFNKLTAINLSGFKSYKRKDNNRTQNFAIWLCKCDCGKYKKIALNKLPNTKSCGCLKTKDGYEINKNKLFYSYDKNHKVTISKDEFFKKIVMPCVYCGNVLMNEYHRSKFYKNVGFKYTGLDRIDSSKGYEEGNIVPCCSICNYMKRHHSIDKFIKHITKIVNYYKSDI